MALAAAFLVWPAPRWETGDLHLYLRPEARYSAVRLSAIEIGRWVASAPAGGSSSGPIDLYLVVRLELPSGPRWLWLQRLAAPIGGEYSPDINDALR